MKNFEKYADKIKTYTNGSSFCEEIITPNVLKPLGKSCLGTGCAVCNSLTTLWLMEEYEEPEEEPEVDWSKVAVDTPILVKEKGTHFWNRAYFAQHKDGVVWAWCGGRTSWSESVMKDWEYAKLAETEGAE